MTILVVGAGFAGAVYARTLADHGFSVDVIDQRDHIAGNAFDQVDKNGVRVHKYGPHLFHTSNEMVMEWITQFGEFVHYRHKAYAKLASGQFVDFPVNVHTIASVLSLDANDAASIDAAILKDTIASENPKNAAEFLYANIGKTITDLFFRPYTEKMWAITLEDMDVSIVKRVSVRRDAEDCYFPNDRYQVLPKHGYHQIFSNILNHENIRVNLNTAFVKEMERDYSHVFNSMAIDEYFDCQFGPLPYRSLKFENSTHNRALAPARSVVNYTDTGICTRETWWHILPSHDLMGRAEVTRTTEIPCDYKDNNFERYYPVKTADDRFACLYQKYKSEEAKFENIYFIGRCGTYQYLDMHQVINQSLVGVRRFIAMNS